MGVVFDAADPIGGLTGRQNLVYAQRLLGSRRSGRTIDEVLERVGMLPHADRRAGRLSLGQKRRLTIARALLGDPELLILDEPLSGLDTVGVRSMLSLFRALAGEGATLVLSSHRLLELQTLVSHVGILHRGRLVLEGELDAVLAAGGGGARLRAAPRERALELLRTLPDVLLDDTLADGAVGAEAAEIRLLAGERPLGEINRLLVEFHEFEERIQKAKGKLQVDLSGFLGTSAAAFETESLDGRYS